MTDKKTTKTEKETEAKKPVELKDEELETPQGGGLEWEQFRIVTSDLAPRASTPAKESGE